MKFSLAIDMSRHSPDQDMQAIERHTLEMVQMADLGGFEIVWAAEHHAIEMTIAPSPFQLLAWYAAHTDNIRLGTAVVQAPYWHPVKLAGEAALLDLLSGGRLEFGIGRGAYQREFDRMMGGMDQHKGVAYMQEMLPLLNKLWQGDSPTRASSGHSRRPPPAPSRCRRRIPPLWVAARHPTTYDWALPHGLQHHVLGADPALLRGREVQAAVRGGAGPRARTSRARASPPCGYRGLREPRTGAIYVDAVSDGSALLREPVQGAGRGPERLSRGDHRSTSSTTRTGSIPPPCATT